MHCLIHHGCSCGIKIFELNSLRAGLFAMGVKMSVGEASPDVSQLSCVYVFVHKKLNIALL